MRYSSLIAGWLVCVGLWCGSGTLGAAPGQALPELDLLSSGEIVIGPDGAVLSHALDPGLQPQVRELVEKNIRTWRFDPILVEGRAVKARTRMNLELSALPNAAGNYVLRVERAWFGAPRASADNRPPRYPREALEARISAKLLLLARIDEQGRVVDVHPYQTSLDRETRTDDAAKRWRRQFERAGIATVSKWRFDPGEEIGGQLVGGSVMVPIYFQITPPGGSRTAMESWRAYFPGPVSPAPWVTDSSLVGLDPDALRDGDALPLDSRFRLVSDVIGKAL
jgi:hypothetical protein